MNKKIFTTVALVAAGVAFASADTITFDSALTNAGNNTTETYASVWEIAESLDFEAGRITTEAPYAYNGHNAIYSADNASYGKTTNPVVITFSTSSLYTDADVADGDTFSLTTLEFMTRSGANVTADEEIKSAYAYIYEYSNGSFGSLLGVSSSTGTITSENGDGVYGTASYSFSGVELTLGNVYAIVFSESNDANSMSDTVISDDISVAVGFGQLNPYMSGGNGFEINGTNGYSSIYRLTVAAPEIPEPSMFGLLAGLGTLGFVATRRRRNRKA
ncbi:MAG: PEP-CTERM sorting domain-containing protein [Opitutae bacterium]|nr:PEP-CTERM sorting domain-containing protein [Opitutae bacterium]